MTNRVTHIDIAKGISIIFVALFHSKLKLFIPDVVNSLSLIRVPLFFFLSGVFFSASADARTFLLKKSDALLKPYFVTLLAVLVITTIFLKEDHLALNFAMIFYGNSETIRWDPMWFLTHLFAVFCFTYCIFRFTDIQEKNIPYKVAILVVLMIIGTQWIDAFWHVKINLLDNEVILPGLPFSVDIVFITSSFFIMGAFLRKMVINFNPNLYMLSISTLVYFAIVSLTDAHIDLNGRTYTNPLLATTGAICGIYFIIYTSFYINKTTILRNIFLTFGQASLFILIFHSFIDARSYTYFSESGTHDLDFWYAISAFIICIIAPVLIRFIVTKNVILSLIYLPLKPNKGNSADVNKYRR